MTSTSPERLIIGIIDDRDPDESILKEYDDLVKEVLKQGCDHYIFVSSRMDDSNCPIAKALEKLTDGKCQVDLMRFVTVNDEPTPKDPERETQVVSLAKQHHEFSLFFSDHIRSMKARFEFSDLFIVFPGSKQAEVETLMLLKYLKEWTENRDRLHQVACLEASWKYLPSFLNQKNGSITYYNRESGFSNAINVFKAGLISNPKEGENATKLEFSEKEDADKNKTTKIDITKRFQKLFCDIRKSLHHESNRPYDCLESKLGEYIEEDILISLDFGAFTKDDATKRKRLSYLSYATDEYTDVLKGFLNDHGSVLLADNPASLNTYSLVGNPRPPFQVKLDQDDNAHFVEKSTAPNPESLKLFLQERNLGRTLIWRNIIFGAGNEPFRLNQAVFCLLNCVLPETKEKDLIGLIGEFLVDVTPTKVSELFDWKNQHLIQQALRSAISQVMARNASHNLGSHVLNRLTAPEILAKYDGLNDGSHHYQSKIIFSVGENEGATKENKRPTIFNHIAWFNEYLKTRMDYLGDITWGVPMMETSKRLYQEIFLGFDRVRLLLDHISGLTNFKFKIEVKLDGRPINSLSAEYDPILAIPNDLLGMQAFYNILENIIRNTAKHGKKDESKPTIFTIHCFDHRIDLKSLNEDREFFCIEVFDSLQVDDIKGRVKEQNIKLAASILQEGTRLRSRNLGLIEMTASAAYLRGMDMAMVESKFYKIEDTDQTLLDPTPALTSARKLPILRAINRDGCLGYQFYLRKPQEVLFVVGELVALSDDRKKELASNGIYQITPSKLRQVLEEGYICHHSFLVSENLDFIEQIAKYKIQLPKRILSADNNFVSRTLKEELVEGIIEEVWRLRGEDLKQKYGFIDFRIRASPNERNRCEKPTCFQAILLDHGGVNWAKYKDSKYRPIIGYLDPMGSAAQRQLPFFQGDMKNYPNQILNEVIPKVQLLESCVCKFVVIDERIQPYISATASYEGVDIPIHEIYDRIGIIIPKRQKIDLANQNLHAIKDKVLKFIERKIRTLNPHEDFVVFHYSLLTRIFDQSTTELTSERIDSYLTNLAVKARVIVTSGAGSTPYDLPQGVGFVNLSPLISSISVIQSKYLATKLLFSSRNKVQL